MAKVIPLSRNFLKGHPKAGQPTHFTEKAWKSLLSAEIPITNYIYGIGGYQYADQVTQALSKHTPKHHTIRGGKRWKDGDMASLRVWSDEPYNSKQIIIAPDVKLKVRDVAISIDWDVWIDDTKLDAVQIKYLAQNDGLSYMDMVNWFGKSLPFSGQLLIWNEKNLIY